VQQRPGQLAQRFGRGDQCVGIAFEKGPRVLGNRVEQRRPRLLPCKYFRGVQDLRAQSGVTGGGRDPGCQHDVVEAGGPQRSLHEREVVGEPSLGFLDVAALPCNMR